jgi:hypothetical protein
MKYYILLLSLFLVPVMSQAALGDNFKNAVNEAPAETQDAVLQARIKALTATMNAAKVAVNQVNAQFQTNAYFSSEDKAKMQSLTDSTLQQLDSQISAIATAQSNEELDQLREQTKTNLQGYEDEVKVLIHDATIRAYETMIAQATKVLDEITKLIPVLKAAGVDVTALETQIALCYDDIDAANAAFYPAIESKDPNQIKVASQAIAKLAQDLAKLVQIAEELAS